MLPEKRKEILSLPNILSYVRILLLIPFVVLYCKYNNYVWSAAVIIFSGLTDVADGFIARRYKMTTEWGKILDPLADKLTQATVTACLIFKYHPQMVYLLIVIVIKEGMQGIGGLLLYRKLKKMRSSEWFGKLSTFFFFALVAYLILLPDFALSHMSLTNGLIIVSGALMVTALALYIRRFVQAVRAPREDPEPEDGAEHQE